MNKRKEKLRRRQAPRETGTMTGRLRVARNGAGYLVAPETDKAVWIEERDLGTALPDDTVTVKLKGSGDEGVLLLISDSTNVERPGFTMSESHVGETLESYFISLIGGNSHE